jgi:hypothetical protein
MACIAGLEVCLEGGMLRAYFGTLAQLDIGPAMMCLCAPCPQGRWTLISIVYFCKADKIEDWRIVVLIVILLLRD